MQGWIEPVSGSPSKQADAAASSGFRAENQGRPRIDVVLQVTSVYRDQFDGLMRLLADAIDRQAQLDEPGEADMRITVKEGEELTRYEASGEIGEGQGVRAGVTYRLPDGRMIYVPE